MKTCRDTLTRKTQQFEKDHTYLLEKGEAYKQKLQNAESIYEAFTVKLEKVVQAQREMYAVWAQERVNYLERSRDELTEKKRKRGRTTALTGQMDFRQQILYAKITANHQDVKKSLHVVNGNFNEAFSITQAALAREEMRQHITTELFGTTDERRGDSAALAKRIHEVTGELEKWVELHKEDEKAREQLIETKRQAAAAVEKMKKKEEVFIKVEQEYENCVKKSDEKMRELKVATEHADAAEADTDVAKHELFKSNQDRDHLRGSDEAILMTELEEKLKSTMAEIEARQDKGKIGELRGRLAVAKGSLDDTRGSLEKMQAELAKLQTETVPGLQQRLERPLLLPQWWATRWCFDF